MNDGTPQAEPLPSFYVYKRDGQWTKTSKALTDEINRHIFFYKDFDCQGYSFIPQWDEPDYKSTTKTAWYLGKDGELRVRWTITVNDHKKGHHGCTPIGDGSCLMQCPLKVGWDPQKKFWTIVEPPNKATGEQMRKFNNNFNH